MERPVWTLGTSVKTHRNINYVWKYVDINYLLNVYHRKQNDLHTLA